MTARAIMIVGFAALIAIMIVVDLTARRPSRDGRAREHGAGTANGTPAPLGKALTAAMRTGTGRLLVLGVWLWLGWHFLAR